MSGREPFVPFAYITSHPQGIPLKIVEPTPEFVREVETDVTVWQHVIEPMAGVGRAVA